MLHPTKTGVAQIARSDPMEMRSRFPVAPVHDNQYGHAELLMRLQDPITSTTADDHCMLCKFNVFLFIHSMSAPFGYSTIHWQEHKQNQDSIALLHRKVQKAIRDAYTQTVNGRTCNFKKSFDALLA